jgi:glycosyltransferase involved in cell wall biosynthesis
MDRQRKIERYLLDEFYREICERDRNEFGNCARFFYQKSKEFYWTLSRFAGVGHRHDGSWRPVDERTKTASRTILHGEIPAPLASPRILIDMSPTHYSDARSGIQRVVREIARVAIESGAGLPVYIDNGRLRSHFRHPSLPDAIEIADGDKFLMLDAGWGHQENYLPIMEEISRKNGANIACLYDLIPILFPKACAPSLTHNYEIWFDKIILASDAVVGISKSVVEEFRNYTQNNRKDALRRHIGWFYLGADFHAESEDAPSAKTEAVCSIGAPYFLTVGTLEPRKGYVVALTAFEKLWGSGVDVRYVIVGKYGWNLRALQRRIREHPEYNRRLFWFDNASDADLQRLYKGAHGFVYPSFAEGFGLPIIEATHHGLPALVSDIPIFHEIGQDKITFFDLLDSGSLARKVLEALENDRLVASLPVLSWRDAAMRLLHMVRNDAYQFRCDASVPRSHVL